MPRPDSQFDNFAPILFEGDAYDLPVSGALPRDLAGTLYRNGPNPHFPSPQDHWFVGDGMIHSFAIENGRVSYRSRWVRTPKWLAEHDAGRALFGGFGQKLPGAPDHVVGGVANTNIVWHGGRLLALEEAHLPTEIAPGTLETRGYTDFGGGTQGPFTAHPKIDPVTGEMIFFGYGARGQLSAGMSFGTLDSSGRVTRFDRFDAPYSSMVHDFIVTDRHVLFPILPLTGSMERAMRGAPAYAWEPDKGAYVGVLRRGAPVDDMIWFRGESCYVFHIMNAWEDGDRIIADVMQFEEPPLFPHADGGRTDPAKSAARLHRWTFDLSGNTDRFQQTPLDDLAGEFPRIDDRRAGLGYRHGWYACNDSARGNGESFGGIAHMDMQSGARKTFMLPAGDATSEPVFVPRAENAPEGDGYLLSVVWRAAENRSDLVVLDATDIAKGPVATVQLPVRVPFGFHGNWVGA
jgi:carotenoid cleavage dioxygenase-like enzyme